MSDKNYYDIEKLKYTLDVIDRDLSGLNRGFIKMIGMMKYLISAVDDLKKEKNDTRKFKRSIG